MRKWIAAHPRSGAWLCIALALTLAVLLPMSIMTEEKYRLLKAGESEKYRILTAAEAEAALDPTLAAPIRYHHIRAAAGYLQLAGGKRASPQVLDILESCGDTMLQSGELEESGRVLLTFLAGQNLTPPPYLAEDCTDETASSDAGENASEATDRQPVVLPPGQLRQEKNALLYTQRITKASNIWKRAFSSEQEKLIFTCRNGYVIVSAKDGCLTEMAMQYPSGNGVYSEPACALAAKMFQKEAFPGNWNGTFEKIGADARGYRFLYRFPAGELILYIRRDLGICTYAVRRGSAA